MGPLSLADHLLSFLAPALGVALGVAVLARLFFREVRARGWWVTLAANFFAGAAMLVLGLWYFGHDGKMATYAALVLAVATSQWALGRGWRR